MASSNHDGTWTLTHAEYQEIKHYRDFLSALEAAGVEDWDGYREAQDRYDQGDF
ncbi:hypothetical protein [Streptomyces sp. NPDC002644]